MDAEYGQDGIPAEEALEEQCQHPTNQAFYESGLDEDGYEFENYYCAVCNRYLTIPMMLEIRERPDWITWRTEDDNLTISVREKEGTDGQ